LSNLICKQCLKGLCLGTLCRRLFLCLRHMLRVLVRRIGRARGRRYTSRVSVEVSSMFYISCRRLVGVSTSYSRRPVDVSPKCAPPNPTVPTWEIDSCELRWPYGQLQSTVLKSALGPDLGSCPPGALPNTVRNSRGWPALVGFVAWVPLVMGSLALLLPCRGL
jgi:hypothetical protein